MSERESASPVTADPFDDGAPVEPPAPEPNPAILEDLHSMLARGDAAPGALEEEIRDLGRTHGEAVYTELIYLLSHLRFPPSEARPHWERIVRHRESMQRRLSGPVDVRVALISYFLEVNQQLHNPKIIEMQLFERERATAYRDDLTGLYNHRLFREHLTREVHRARRWSRPVSLVMIDVDHFKHYNDLNGHEAGNRGLAEIARELNRMLRKSDVAVRYGGEEFALILPGTPKTDAQIVAERMRRAIDERTFSGEEGLPDASLTVSMGVATFPADASDPSELVRHADRALYVAKARGRNQVSLYGRSRRSYGRIRVELPGSFRVLADESHALTTINVSEAGMLFRADARLAVGTVLEVTVEADPNRKITAAGRVVHVETAGDGTFRTAVCITDARNAARARLMALVRDAGAEEFPVADPRLVDLGT
jgi:diguanylate cyclase (GGDEF)-like protein